MMGPLAGVGDPVSGLLSVQFGALGASIAAGGPHFLILFSLCSWWNAHPPSSCGYTQEFGYKAGVPQFLPIFLAACLGKTASGASILVCLSLCPGTAGFHSIYPSCFYHSSAGRCLHWIDISSGVEGMHPLKLYAALGQTVLIQ